jgi:glycosyltransferase involved in cell wall biosynthesis
LSDKDSPLVSITIPTRNEQKHLAQTLAAIATQSYRNIEVLVVDGNSSDETVQIAIQNGARVLICYQGLLAARCVGAHESQGEYIMLLDADQILQSTAIERAVSAIRGNDMVILEEGSFMPGTAVQRAIARERLLRHEWAKRVGLLDSGLAPRFFRASFLREIFEKLDMESLQYVVAQDHAIISDEARKLSDNVRILPSAVYHTEEANLRELFIHYYSFGKSEGAVEQRSYPPNTRPAGLRLIPALDTVLSGRSLTLALVIFLRSFAYRLGRLVRKGRISR